MSDRFDSMRSKGINTYDADATSDDIMAGKTAYVQGRKVIGTATGGGGNTGIIPAPADLVISSVPYQAGKQEAVIGVGEDTTGAMLYLKEGSYPTSTDDGDMYQIVECTNGENIFDLNQKADGTYPYRLYCWAVATNDNGGQTWQLGKSLYEYNVMYASGSWNEVQAVLGTYSYSNGSSTCNQVVPTIIDNLMVINTPKGMLVIDTEDNVLTRLNTDSEVNTSGTGGGQVTVLHPRENVYLIRAYLTGKWFEYNKQTRESHQVEIGNPTYLGEYNGYYFFNGGNTNYKKSTGAIVTSCTDGPTSSSYVYFSELAGIFYITGSSSLSTCRKLNLSNMTYEDVGTFTNADGSVGHVAVYSVGFFCDNTGTVWLWNGSTSGSSAYYRFNGSHFVPASFPKPISPRNFDYTICGISPSNHFCDSNKTYVTNGTTFSTFCSGTFTNNYYMSKLNLIKHVTCEDGTKVTIVVGQNGVGTRMITYRLNSSGTQIYSTDSNWYYGYGSSDPNHEATSGGSWNDGGYNYLGYHNGKHWRIAFNGIYYLRTDNGFWQRVIYDTRIPSSMDRPCYLIDGNYFYYSNGGTFLKIDISVTNGTIEEYSIPSPGNCAYNELKKIGNYIYIVPVAFFACNTYTNVASTNTSSYCVAKFDIVNNTIETSTTLRGGLRWGENKYFEPSKKQITNILTEEIEETHNITLTRYAGVNSLNTYFSGYSMVYMHSGETITVMYAKNN